MNRTAYPIQFSVDYPDRPLDRVKTLIRPVAAIPIDAHHGIHAFEAAPADPMMVGGGRFSALCVERVAATSAGNEV